MCRRLISLLCKVFVGVPEAKPEAASLITWGDGSSPRTSVYIMMWCATVTSIHNKVMKLADAETDETELELLMVESAVQDPEYQAQRRGRRP